MCGGGPKFQMRKGDFRRHPFADNGSGIKFPCCNESILLQHGLVKVLERSIECQVNPLDQQEIAVDFDQEFH